MTVTVAPPSLSGSATSTTARTARRQLMSTPIAAGGASLHDTSSSRSSLSTVADSSDDAYSLRMLPVSSRNASAIVGISSLPATSTSGRNIATVNAHFRDPTLSTWWERTTSRRQRFSLKHIFCSGTVVHKYECGIKETEYTI